MKQRIEILTNKHIEELKQKTQDYFELQGFELLERNPREMIFKRGNIFLNMVTFNPLKWKSLITVQFFDRRVIANFDIDTTFQITSSEEEKLWNQFVENYQKTLVTEDSFISDNFNELSLVKQSQWKYLLYACLGAVLFGIPFGLVGYFIENFSVGLYGFIGGSLVMLMWKIDKDKKEQKSE